MRVIYIFLGNSPDLVCRHLAKLYDSVADLRWKLEGGKRTKYGMNHS